MKKSIFDKINSFLCRRGHELVMSVFLDGYNGNHIYIRLDYVPKIGVYKVVWFDLDFINERKLENYVNVQMMTRFMAEKLIRIMIESKYESGIFENKKIIGDRVEVISYLREDRYEFVFDRFLPLEWAFLINPLIILFTYLPKGMECILNEIFAKFDKLEEKYNLLKPFKFALMKDDLTDIFKKSIIEYAQVLVDQGKISILEKINDRYMAIVDGKNPFVVIVTPIKEGFIKVSCNCNDSKACVHLAAVILAIRQKKKFNSFYKLKLIENDKDTLLDKITNPLCFLCFGLVEDRVLIVSDNGDVYEEPIVRNGRVQFEVIEDDDEMSLSKVLEKYKK